MAFWKQIPAILALLLVISVNSASAGTSWLDQGNKLLNSLGIGDNTADTAAGLSMQDITAGLKQALEKGAQNVVNRLSALDGFNRDDKVRIPLPENLSAVKSLLDNAGLGRYTDEVELRLNRAAEAAAPKARALFLDAVSRMTFDDARAILNGADDAATQYFREHMSPGLAAAMAPVIDRALEQVGAVRAYDTMMGQYKTLPFVPDIKGDLTSHTVEKAMDGIFFYLAQEEKSIRENPAERTTDLLKKVFK